MEKQKEKEKKNNNFELSHKEGFSLEATTTKNNTNSESKLKPESTENSFNPNQQMYYMYNPMMMNPMDSKGTMNQGFYFYPVFVDPNNMPKDMNMNGQNMGMFYPPMMPMYPQNFGEQTYSQNSNKK